ncbi:MAG: hypothetical protein Q8K75_01595 [Chlamydiales bacterium]|nr:hypothetical protein [Chlamydiales bacterium]
MENKLIDVFPTVAYTHGLERIYALEAVDLSSVRPISLPKPKAVVTKRVVPLESDQFSLDLGPGFRSWVSSTIWQEPISVLGLSHHTERVLLEADKHILDDLRDVNLLGLGLGQGHVDEVVSKLETYTSDSNSDHSTCLNIGSCIRALMRFCDLRAGYVLLQEFGLEGLSYLQNSAINEIRRATPDRLERLREEARISLRGEAAKQLVHRMLSEAIDAFVKPWMRQREGIATRSELLERLERIATPNELTKPFIALLNDLFGDLELFLETISGVFCADSWIAEQCDQVIQCTCSYFYNKNVWYDADHLVRLVQTELAKDWLDLSDCFVIKVLSCSKGFRVRKSHSGRVVQLA